MVEIDERDVRFKEIGLRIKQLRLQHGYSNSEKAAFSLDVNRICWYRAESGKPQSVKSLLRYLTLFNTTLQEFFMMPLDEDLQKELDDYKHKTSKQ